MIKNLAMLLALASPASLLAQIQLVPSQALVFDHVTIIDVGAKDANHALKLDQTVVVSGDRISDLGNAGTVHIPAGAQVIDATSKFLMPGLWDMHVHLNNDQNLGIALNLLLANGVTGVRQMGGNLESVIAMREQLASGSLLGPRMVVAGRIDGPYGPNDRNPRAVRNAEQARAAVRLAKEAGVDFIKLYSYLSPEAFFGAIDEAKKLGLAAAGHVPWGVKASDAAKAGYKSIEHVQGVAVESSDIEDALREQIVARVNEGQRISVPEIEVDHGPRYRDSYSPQRQERLNAVFVEYRTWHCPTLVVSDFSNLGAYAANGFEELPYQRYVPKARHADLKRHLSRAWSADAQSDPKVYTANKRALVVAMHRSGVQFLACTDAPAFVYLVPGFSMHDELVLLIQAGFAPLQALQAATINPARFLDQEKQLGTVERGKVADLILLDANPLEDIRNTRRINSVVTNGRYLPKPTLQTMLAEVEAWAGKESIAQAVFTTIQEKGIAPALEQYRELREERSATYQLDEGEMNIVGYRPLRAKKVKEAIAVFKLNVAAFPNSSNVYDSLAEAYEAYGQKQLAIDNYEKSLALNPQNFNAVERLRKLQAK